MCSFSSTLAKILPWTDNATASRVNIRDELLQNSLMTSNINDQGHCESCVTNAIVTATEYTAKRHLLFDRDWPFSPYTLRLSVPQVLGCTNADCSKQDPESQLDRMINGHVEVVLRQDNNVSQQPGTTYSCIDSPDNVQLIDYAKASTQSVKNALLQHFGVLATIAHTQSICGQDYIDYDTSTSDLNHEVAIIGYDDNDNGGVWIVQNSWGPSCHKGGSSELSMAKRESPTLWSFSIRSSLLH